MRLVESARSVTAGLDHFHVHNGYEPEEGRR